MLSEGLSRRTVLSLAAGLAASAAMPFAGFARPAPIPSNGINIPLWLDDPHGPGLAPSHAVLEFLHEAGFRTVRLPFDPDRLVADVRARQAMLSEIEDALTTLLDLGFSVTLDMHPMGVLGKALAAGPDAELGIAAAWTHVAGLAGHHPADRIYLELLNEPPMWRNRWLPLRDRLAAAVREAAPDHTIIWGANRWQSIAETIDCPPLVDPNALVAVHYYSPMELTHRCQNWGAPEASSDIEASHWSPGEIIGDFERLAHWSARTGTTAVLNEFGVLGHCVESGARAAWTRAVRRAAESNGIGWSYWEFDRGFGFLAGRTDPAVSDDLLFSALAQAA
ncbi:glycoside hydrolase family 5 protein [Pelagibacterium sediminicola]|uniref:glycoside hydrolase family 5 protein n=1 Tax=Pelagibacterium sediminicola TaxID=2248761 RepID=UPI001300B9ED|nr:cellulase family glycosylhydrolase [Pelagibacterium sediminicola]